MEAMHGASGNLLMLRFSSTVLFLGLLYFVNRKLYRRELSFTLGTIWSLALLGALVLSISPKILFFFANQLGAEVPVHLLSFLVQLFLVLLVFGLTLKSAQQERKIIRLTQEIALLRLDMEYAQTQGSQDMPLEKGSRQIRVNE